MVQRLNLVGRRFGRLLVIADSDEGKYGRLYVCKCDCGKVKKVHSSNLRNGGTQSCGCMRIENSTAKIRLDFGEASFRGLLSRYKRGAKNRSLSWDLTTNEFRDLTKGNCYYCGSGPSNKADNAANNGEYIYSGIDRIDNNVGYKKENCVSCCRVCNFMKVKMDQSNFIEQAIKIAEHQTSRTRGRY